MITAEADMAVCLMLAGQVERGLACYRACLAQLRAGGTLPVGAHVRMLEAAGAPLLAGRVRELGLQAGADLAHGDDSTAEEPSVSADRYRALFADGIVNARMFHHYLLALDRLGDQAEIAALLDPARLFRRCRVVDPTPEEVVQATLDRQDQAVSNIEGVSIQQMRTLFRLDRMGHAVFERLLSAFTAEVARYIADLRQWDHPFTRWMPTDFQIVSWALISGADGFNTPHLHPRAWVTGVYYATALPDSSSGGQLRIGRPPGVSPDATGWPDLTIEPEPGLLVLMPGIYLHWRDPMRCPGLRIAVAFDVIASNRAQAEWALS